MPHKIMLAFVRSDSDILESSWLNRAAASLATTSDGSTPFIHAELLFVPPEETTSTSETSESVNGEAMSIVYSGAVHLEKKRFSRQEWFFRSMECTKTQYDSMLEFAREHKGEGFNHMGYFMFWSPLRPSPMFYTWLGMKPRWFCSEIVVSALKHGGLLADDVTPSMHPNELYKLVQGTSMADCGRNLKSVTLSFV